MFIHQQSVSLLHNEDNVTVYSDSQNKRLPWLRVRSHFHASDSEFPFMSYLPLVQASSVWVTAFMVTKLVIIIWMLISVYLEYVQLDANLCFTVDYNPYGNTQDLHSCQHKRTLRLDAFFIS